MDVRYELESDIALVWQLNVQAFPSIAEADLVNNLRANADCISLVAENGDEIVGHILFSPVYLEESTDVCIAGLAPMAVLPEMQNNGIGSMLIRKGISECRAKGVNAIAVLGHPNYYPKFGFVPSAKFGIRSEYDVPDDVFMIQELTSGSLRNKTGTIKYHDAFRNI